MFYDVVRWTSIPLFALYFRLAVEGQEHVPASGPFLVAANHLSYLDPAVLGSACPRRVHFLMNAAVMSLPALGWFYRGMQAIPIDPSPSVTREAFKRALARLGQGRGVGIFPEGARAGQHERLDEGRLGVAVLARRSGAPVVPVGIAGAELSMPRGAAWPRPARVRVVFGPPVVHQERGREADQRFTDTLMTTIAGLVASARANRCGQQAPA